MNIYCYLYTFILILFIQIQTMRLIINILVLYLYLLFPIPRILDHSDPRVDRISYHYSFALQHNAHINSVTIQINSVLINNAITENSVRCIFQGILQQRLSDYCFKVIWNGMIRPLPRYIFSSFVFSNFLWIMFLRFNCAL